MTERKSFGLALIIWFFFGGFGGHRIYVQEKASVILWYWLAAIFTLSIICWIDLFRLKSMIRTSYEEEVMRERALRA
ncbi:NINE protein [Fictibacillus iocasae]|uniref:NINE protein n=1 Tax=Fictibacillus iocasae TaxID=2715437 RepID=A0ABW2NL10_9BACL